MTPDVLSKLRPWQPAVVEAAIAGLATGNFLNGSDLGTGKTFCAVAAAKLLNRRLLAVCRIGARNTWHEAGKLFGMDPNKIETINRELLRSGTTKYGHWQRGPVNGNTGKTAKTFKWTVPSDTLLVVDEIHHDAGLDSANSKVLRAAVKDGLKIIGLSGTAADDPRKMRAIGYMLGLHKDTDFYTWLARYGADVNSWNCGVDPEFIEQSIGREMLRARRELMMTKIHQQMKASGRFVRVRKSEIPNFPKCTIEPVCYEFNQLDLKAVLDDMRIELEQLRRISGNPKKEQREVMMRALQKAELYMVPGLVEETEEAIEQGHTVAIFVQFSATVQALAKRLNTDCLYTGAEPHEVREVNRMRIQRDEERKIILNVGAGAESIGIQDVTGRFPRLGLVTPGFNPVTMNQLFGRLPRDGGKTPSIYRILFPAGTILEAAYRACKAKTERINAFNGDIRLDEEDLTAGLNL